MKLSVMLEVHCPTLFEQPEFAAWLNMNVGQGLATWHCGGEPGEMSDVFVLFDHGEGDYSPESNPDHAMPQFAWAFITARVADANEEYALVRLINTEGDERDDYNPAAEAVDTPLVVQEVAGVFFNAVLPTVRPGDRVLHSEPNESLEGVVTGFATHKGEEVILLDGGKWCYRHQVIRAV